MFQGPWLNSLLVTKCVTRPQIFHRWGQSYTSFVTFSERHRQQQKGGWFVSPRNSLLFDKHQVKIGTDNLTQHFLQIQKNADAGINLFTRIDGPFLNNRFKCTLPSWPVCQIQRLHLSNLETFCDRVWYYAGLPLNRVRWRMSASVIVHPMEKIVCLLVWASTCLLQEFFVQPESTLCCGQEALEKWYYTLKVKCSAVDP